MIQMAVSCNWDQQDSKAGNGLDKHQTSVACIFAPLDLGTFQPVGPQDPQIVDVRIPLLAHILPECALFLLNEFS